MTTSLFFDQYDKRIRVAPPYSHEYEVRVPRRFWGLTIDQYYSTRFPYKNKDLWLTSMEQGTIRMNGILVKPDTLIPEHAVIYSYVENIIEPPVNPDWIDLYEDDDMIVINKPGHLPVHPTGRFFKHSLLERLKEKNPDQKFHILHRLDVETSGVLIVGKTKTLASAFFKMFKYKDIAKEYLALVYGNFPDEEIDIDKPLGRSIKSSIGVKMEVDGLDAKEARTVFKKVEDRNGYSLINCRPMTGRTNQIRSHLEYIGFPILGDKMYCSDDSVFNDYHQFGETESLKKKLLLYRQALHACKIEFVHPLKNEKMTFEAPFPEDIDYHPDHK